MNFIFKASAFLAMLVFIISCNTTPTPVNPPEDAQPERVRVVREYVDRVDTLMPLSISVLRRLGDIDMQKIQFIIFGRILLEREFTASQAVPAEGGRARITISHIRNSILINDQLEGAILERPVETSGKIILPVCFETDERYLNCKLTFEAKIDDPDGYFYLVYSPADGGIMYGDEKGRLDYGGEIYRLRFTGDKAPYLLIRLTQSEVEQLNPREVPGRKITD